MKTSIKLSASSVLALTVILFTGCDGSASVRMGVSGTDTPYPYDKVCVDSVVYLEGSKKISPWVNPKTMTFSKCKIVNGKLVIIKTMKDF